MYEWRHLSTDNKYNVTISLSLVSSPFPNPKQASHERETHTNLKLTCSLFLHYQSSLLSQRLWWTWAIERTIDDIVRTYYIIYERTTRATAFAWELYAGRGRVTIVCINWSTKFAVSPFLRPEVSRYSSTNKHLLSKDGKLFIRLLPVIVCHGTLSIQCLSQSMHFTVFLGKKNPPTLFFFSLSVASYNPAHPAHQSARDKNIYRLWNFARMPRRSTTAHVTVHVFNHCFGIKVFE